MKLPAQLIWLGEKLLENLLPTIWLLLIGGLLLFRRHVDTLVSEVFPNPTPSLVSDLVLLILALLLTMFLAYLWLRRKFIHPKPNLSRKSSDQEQILVALKDTKHLSEVSSALKMHEQSVLHEMETLKTSLLVDRPSNLASGNSMWLLTKSGRAYLAKYGLL